MKLEEAMFVRTKYHGILKYGDRFLLPGEILKASHNIIDLIEVGDYVNGYKVTEIIDKPTRCLKTEYKLNLAYVYFMFYERDIKSIVTKKQFESMSYKVN